MKPPAEIASWPGRLEQALHRSPGILRRVTVIEETNSTMDAARRLAARVGDVIVAARQTAGRARMGKRWAHTGDEGVAVTLALPSDMGESLAIIAAVAIACAVEPFLNRRVGIKWPNDILVDQRKLAGILIEQSGEVALVGVGINVLQENWPAELPHAVSLRQAAAAAAPGPVGPPGPVGRADVAEALLQCFNHVLRMPESVALSEWEQRDVLTGRTARFMVGPERIEGRVRRIEPLRGLLVETAKGQRWLPAAVTSVEEIMQ